MRDAAHLEDQVAPSAAGLGGLVEPESGDRLLQVRHPAMLKNAACKVVIHSIVEALVHAADGFVC